MARLIDSKSWTGINPPETPEPLDPSDLKPVSAFRRSAPGQARAAITSLLLVLWFLGTALFVVTLLRVLGGDASAMEWMKGPDWERYLVLLLSPFMLLLNIARIWWQGRQIFGSGAVGPVLRLDGDGFEDSRNLLGFIPWQRVVRFVRYGRRGVALDLAKDTILGGGGGSAVSQLTIETRSLAAIMSAAAGDRDPLAARQGRADLPIAALTPAYPGRFRHRRPPLTGP